MGPDGVISPHSSANGLIMSIWRRLGMGSSPYSPVIPLVICLPPRPLTGALMVRRRGGAFWWQISLLPPPPPPPKTPTLPHFWYFYLCGAQWDATSCVVPVIRMWSLTLPKPSCASWKQVGTLMTSYVNVDKILFDSAMEIPQRA